MAKKSNPEAVKIIALCRELGFVCAELSGGVLVEIPSWKGFQKKLPVSDATPQVRSFHEVARFFERLSGKLKRCEGRWKLWHTGSVGIDGFFADSPTLRKERSKPIGQRRATAKRPWIFGR